MEKTIQQKYVTYDFERQMQGATKVKTSEFATQHDRQYVTTGPSTRCRKLMVESLLQ